MRHLTEQAYQIAQVEAEIEDAHKRRGDLAHYVELRNRSKWLGGLPADHNLTQWECPCGKKWHGAALIICYVTLYERTAAAKDRFILLTDRGEEHHMSFCPDCAGRIEAHHSRRDGVPRALPPAPAPEDEPVHEGVEKIE